MPEIPKKDYACLYCAITDNKVSNVPHLVNVQAAAHESLSQVSVDLMGPFATPSLYGDTYSRYTYGDILRHHSSEQ